MNKKQKMYAQIEKHGENLNKIFNTQYGNIELCKKLFRLENKAHHATTCLCNTNTLNLLNLNRCTGYNVEQATEEQQNAFFEKIHNKLKKILGKKADIIHINFDPKGYALKIKEEYLQDVPLFRDWGNYGIVAPDFRNN